MTKAKISAAKTGENHPMFGKVAANAISVFVYNLNGELVETFTSQVAAAKWLGTGESSVRKYIRSGKVFNGLFIIKKMS
jgi:hypothetical protein